MGRPPCCDKMGIKKGPWTPEEDIILVSYIQEHGPGNWRSVPIKTGLRRCSKSCRLRWTNYLRPGIKRGNFTEHEEKMIIHLQDIIGNRWAAIASYLPQRTDNDIKNYWNTHLKKKLKKLQTGLDGQITHGLANPDPISKGQWERRLQTDPNMAKKALSEALSPQKSENDESFPDTKVPKQGPSYVLTTENVSRLLEKWMENSPKQMRHKSTTDLSSSEGTQSSTNDEIVPVEVLESLLSFESSRPDHHGSGGSQSMSCEENGDGKLDLCLFSDESREDLEREAPLILLEKWLFDESVAEKEEATMEVALAENNGIF